MSRYMGVRAPSGDVEQERCGGGVAAAFRSAARYDAISLQQTARPTKLLLLPTTLTTNLHCITRKLP